ncbi:hypothetical protein [Actinomadura macrotermitis]|uniref:hypothetical protein n=1 Tax=Actinomadura macrotermitis TaxID=2585200 RepID=UPI0012972DF9|nr:hypothetical protein [Actinomadura macrotermitis]
MTAEDIARHRTKQQTEDAQRAAAFLRPGERLFGTARAHVSGAPTPPHGLVPVLYPAPGTNRPDLFGEALYFTEPLQVVSDVFWDGVFGVMARLVPGREPPLDWRSAAGRLVLLTTAVSWLEDYSTEFVAAVTDHRVMIFGRPFGRAPLYPLTEYPRHDFAGVRREPLPPHRVGREEPRVAVVFRDGSWLMLKPDALAGTRLAELLGAG